MHLDQCLTQRPSPTSSFRILQAHPLSLLLLTCLWPEDLRDLRIHLKRLQYCGVYVLTGHDEGRLTVRVGEGFALWDRLPVHRETVSLRFVSRIHLVCAPHYDKALVIKLQEALTDAAVEAGRAAVFSGTGPLRPPVPDPWRVSALAREAKAAVELLELAGCDVFARAHARVISNVSQGVP